MSYVLIAAFVVLAFAVICLLAGDWMRNDLGAGIKSTGWLYLVCALLLAGVTLFTGCASSRGTRAMQVTVVGAGVADLVSTRQAIERGAVEMNPLMGQSLGQQVAVKAAGTAALIWLSSQLEKRSPVVARLLLGAAAIGWSVAAKHNHGVAR